MEATRRVLVTGGGSFLGDAIAAALLAEGADVTLLVRPGAEQKVRGLSQRARLISADVWEPSSLKGRGRGIQSVIHTVGSLTADPSRGLSYQWLNFVSARNVANMCVSSGVPHMVLMSTPRAPWLPAEYVRAKHEAESYLLRIGLRTTLIRAPLTYARGTPRHPFYRLLSLLGAFPLTGWLGFARTAPLPLDVVARGAARITLQPREVKTLYGASDLRKHNSRREMRRGAELNSPELAAPQQVSATIEMLDDEIPFGWTPPGG